MMNGETTSHKIRSRLSSEYIQGLIAENDDETHVVFCQLDTLSKTNENEMIWRESARWVKYEEDVEENGKRWSKPHVASVTLRNVFDLRSELSTGSMMLGIEAMNLQQIADLLIESISEGKSIDENTRNTIRSILVARHLHPHLKRRKTSKKAATPEEVSKLKRIQQLKTSNGHDAESSPLMKLNHHFMKKIPHGAEVANVWVGEVESLKEPITAFIRLKEPRLISDLTEVPLPTRFIFVHLSPPDVQGNIFELGRAMSNMLVDEVFSEVVYKARTREAIMYGIDEFLDQVTVLPPGQWDPQIRIEPPEKVPSQIGRINSEKILEEEVESHSDPTLERTGRLFGGLIADVKRKVPFYFSDIKDGFHIQCLASILYMYLATLTPNITFGALLGLATDQYMGPMECIVTIAFVNIAWALFSGQPLLIMGSTGPVLVLETIIYLMCRDNDWDFLPFRCWVGLWSALFLLIIVAFDLSALVRYITRFTEESFACLIAIIFIVESFKKIFAITEKYPFNTNPDIPLDYTCYCVENNQTDIISNITTTTETSLNSTMSSLISWANVSKEDCSSLGGQLQGPGCNTIVYHDNVFFLSFILGIGTFTIAWTLVNMKNGSFFPTFVRHILSDFAVFISILLMVGLDAYIGINTPKLSVPENIQPSRPDRGWLVNPFSERNPWWTILISALPALVAVILIFMDQQITAVIINRKENKLKKGGGYHLDLTVALLCIAACSLCGLPWYVAATVRSMAHINSLKKESECTAPGEKPTFLGCREQRITPLVVAVLNGCSVFMTSVLQLVPMPVLYGVFLYMGVSALRGMQFMDRMMIMLMPAKYQPDYLYLRHVRIKRVHIFTLLQILCLASLWVIKAIKTISIVFPVMVLGTCFVRKGMEKFFTKNELTWLDEAKPEQEDGGVFENDIDNDNDDDDGPLEFLPPKTFRGTSRSEKVTWNLNQSTAHHRSKRTNSKKGLLSSRIDEMV